ncbi:MAG: FtsX-like permease family protein [Pirellulales bacterium]
MRTALAWHNLTSSRNKLFLSAAGVGFAVLLMFMQIGFRNALLDSNVQLIRIFDADIVIVSRARYNLSSERRFSRSLFESALSVQGVDRGCALRTERTQAVVKVEGHKAKSIRVLSLQPGRGFLKDARLEDQLGLAEQTSGALVDRRSKSSYGFDVDNQDELRQQHVELNNKTLPLSGSFTLGTDFANDGSVLISERTFSKYFPFRSPSGDPLDTVDIGLVKILPGADIHAAVDAIAAVSPGEVDVLTMDDFVARELRFWSRNTPIGVIFGIGTIMGLIVGAIICYQIQFTEISDNMPELATLKAMGYSPAYFWGLILCQSLYLACIGFIPGLTLSWMLYEMLAEASGLVMRLTPYRIGLVWTLTLMMCFVSGSLALRKLQRADPAALF